MKAAEEKLLSLLGQKDFYLVSEREVGLCIKQ